MSCLQDGCGHVADLLSELLAMITRLCSYVRVGIHAKHNNHNIIIYVEKKCLANIPT